MKMSSKNKSYMPNGGYTLTQGSNYMMDGFHFDTEYGGGPQEKARLPEARGLANLPSGMIPLDSSGISMLPDGVEHQADLNMGEITREATQDVTLVDHSWLASQPEPDLSGTAELEQVYKDLAEGHMNNPSNNQIKTLEESWGQTSTTGLDIIPNENRHHAPYQNSYRDDQSHLPGDDYREEMERNVRKLAYGHPMNVVLSEVGESQVLEVKSKLASEYGLHGRVYIKEEHFPGLFNGRWDEVINKRCATAMYIIPNNKDCAFDRFLGMEVVNEVPWNKAAKNLLPKLESYGVRIASGSAKARLQTAFIDLIEGRVNRQEKSATWFPTQLDQSSLISLDHARRELENAREENIFVASSEDVEQSKIEKKLNRIASQLVNQGFLDAEQVSSIVESNRTASKKIERLYELASTPNGSGSYEGQGMGVKAHTPHKSKIEENFKTRSELNLEQRFASAKYKIGRIVKAGMITAKEASTISSRHESPEGKVKAVFDHIAKNIESLSSTYEGQGKNASYHNMRKHQMDANAHVPQKSIRELESRQKSAMVQISKLVNSGLISVEEVQKVAKGKTPEQKVSSVLRHISKPKRVETYNQYDVKEHRMVKSRKMTIEALPSRQKRASANLWKESHAKVDKLLKSGLLSQEDYDRVKNIKDPNDFVRKAFDLASKPTDATQYQGEQTAHILGSKKSNTMTATEKKVANWVRQKMSEGAAGEELDVLIATRFNQNVVDEYGNRIASIRSEHEGLSGHAYVDASAYMTNGVEGCDKGALVHRANQIPTLLKTSKCGSCVFNSGGSCQKYNKPIIASADEIVESPQSYQQEMIRLANASDSEQTASLFVNNYDANEFSLTASEDVSVDDAPSHEELGDVLFGGFEV